MSAYIIMGLIILILVLVIYFTAHVCKQQQADNFELKEQIQKQQKTIADLLRYADEVSQISQDKGKVENAIKEAKTDEELVAIANAIVDANNSSLRQQVKKRK